MWNPAFNKSQLGSRAFLCSSIDPSLAASIQSWLYYYLNQAYIVPSQQMSLRVVRIFFETSQVEYNNIQFTVWDVGGQVKLTSDKGCILRFIH